MIYLHLLSGAVIIASAESESKVNDSDSSTDLQCIICAVCMSCSKVNDSDSSTDLQCIICDVCMSCSKINDCKWLFNKSSMHYMWCAVCMSCMYSAHFECPFAC